MDGLFHIALLNLMDANNIKTEKQIPKKYNRPELEGKIDSIKQESANGVQMVITQLSLNICYMSKVRFFGSTS